VIYRILGAFFILLIFSTFNWAGGNESDFDSVCKYFSDLESLPNIESLNPKERNKFVYGRIQKTLPETSDARVAWEAISHATPEVRYELFQSAAKSTGFKNWACMPMKKLAPVTGEF